MCSQIVDTKGRLLGVEAVDRAAPLDEEGVEDCSDFLDNVECLLEVFVPGAAFEYHKSY